MVQVPALTRTLVSPLDLRNACAALVTDGAMVTLRDSEGVCGVTADSFAMVSLDPPLILVSVSRRNRSHEQLLAEGQFVVNVLGWDRRQRSAPGQVGAGTVQHGLESVSHDLQGGLPALDSARAAIACRVVDAYPAGDHTLIIGQVEQVEQTDPYISPDQPRPVEFTSSEWVTADWPAEMDFAC